jgi:sugar/nucleoside kinase (ribokinase family)
MSLTIPGVVLCSGNIVQDTVVAPVDNIPFGGTQWVEHLEHHLGGNGASSSYTIGILGGRARILGWIGGDDFGAECRRMLESVSVDTRFLKTGREKTAASVALVKTDGSRAFLHRPGVSREAFADFTGFDEAVIEGCSHYHLANPFSLPNFRNKTSAALESARARGLTTSLDTAWDSRGEWMKVLEPCLPSTGLLFANEDEIRMLTGHSDPERAVQVFRNCGAKDIVFKLGAQGCMVFESGHAPFHVPPVPTTAVDTTGAGDCFVGGFLAALQLAFDMRRAAQLANATGSLSVSAFGAVTGLRPLDETLALLSSIAR